MFGRFVALSSRSFSHYVIADDSFFMARHHSLEKRLFSFMFEQLLQIENTHLSDYLAFKLWEEKCIPLGANGFPRFRGEYLTLYQSYTQLRMDSHQQLPCHSWIELIFDGRPNPVNDAPRLGCPTMLDSTGASLMLKYSKRNLVNHFWHKRSLTALFLYTKNIFLWISAARLIFMKQYNKIWR